MSAKMYRIVLVCEDVPKDAGQAAARDITEEFTHRPWHINATCAWDGSQLVLQADNDFDSDGLALCDEFSDAISAYISENFDGDLKILSVTEIDAG
jgi:hypothetical protein